MISDGLEADVEAYYRERESEYRDLNARDHREEGMFIIDCPGCGSSMVLGTGWMGCSVPACPECNDTADTWAFEPRISEERAEELSTGEADVTELVRG
ncbi:hypothetical protein [Halomontanus rarus]|uniref:hypothetical protein n=1 Tax=Halomontanus rarus TaxID=3034020 RepID=UPI0023E7B189|nr:hypothetical protein [Halovivax sp. TS33]